MKEREPHLELQNRIKSLRTSGFKKKKKKGNHFTTASPSGTLEEISLLFSISLGKAKCKVNEGSFKSKLRIGGLGDSVH